MLYPSRHLIVIMVGIMSLPTNEHGLTAHQETFAQGVASGLSYVAAYRIAYPDQVPTSLPGTLYDNAYDLARHPVVAPRIIAIRQELANATEWSLARLVRESEKNLAGAQLDHAWASANGALAYIGKATGLVRDDAPLVPAPPVTQIIIQMPGVGSGPSRIVEAQAAPVLPGGGTAEVEDGG